MIRFANRTFDDVAPGWRPLLLLLTCLPVLIAARVFWQWYPGILPCVLFWMIALADEPLRWAQLGVRRRIAYSLTVIGGLGNAVATIANGGYMPVLRADMSPARIQLAEAGESVWIPLTESSKVPWLCDIYAGWSIGDMFLVGGLLLLLLNWAAEKVELFAPEAWCAGKRLPGLGIG